MDKIGGREMMRNILLIIILFLSFLFSQDFAGYAGSHYSNGSDARSIAMGNAFSAGTDLNYPAFFNPAGVATAQNRKVLFSHQFMTLDRRQSLISFTTPLPPVGGVSFGWVGAGVKNIDGRDVEGRHTDIFSASENGFLISFGLAPFQQFTMGGTVKILQNQLPTGDKTIVGTGIGFDFGILYQLRSDLNFAFVIKNLHSAYQWTNKQSAELSKQYKDKFPAQLRAGIQYEIKSVILVADFGTFFIDNEYLDYDYRLGVEYIFDENYFIRSGLQNNKFACGIGYQLAQFDKFTSNFDYAFVLEPGSSLKHVISYAINF